MTTTPTIIDLTPPGHWPRPFPTPAGYTDEGYYTPILQEVVAAALAWLNRRKGTKEPHSETMDRALPIARKAFAAGTGLYSPWWYIENKQCRSMLNWVAKEAGEPLLPENTQGDPPCSGLPASSASGPTSPQSAPS